MELSPLERKYEDPFYSRGDSDLSITWRNNGWPESAPQQSSSGRGSDEKEAAAEAKSTEAPNRGVSGCSPCGSSIDISKSLLSIIHCPDGEKCLLYLAIKECHRPLPAGVFVPLSHTQVCVCEIDERVQVPVLTQSMDIQLQGIDREGERDNSAILTLQMRRSPLHSAWKDTVRVSPSTLVTSTCLFWILSLHRGFAC